MFSTAASAEVVQVETGMIGLHENGSFELCAINPPSLQVSPNGLTVVCLKVPLKVAQEVSRQCVFIPTDEPHLMEIVCEDK